MNTAMKQCKTCYEFKALDEFRREPQGLLGRKAHCKLCMSTNEYGNYIVKGTDTINIRRVCIIDDKLECLASKAASKAYRRALDRGYLCDNANYYKMLYMYRLKTAYSRMMDEVLHIDHIMPISKGGLHHEDNLQVLTADTNQRKFDYLEGSSGILWAEVHRNKHLYDKFIDYIKCTALY